MTVEYGVVIRRQLAPREVKWQFWLGSGMVKEHASFLVVMNHAGSMGFEAVAAGHFDELGVPEVLLQRKMEAGAFAAKPMESKAVAPAAPRPSAAPAIATPAEKSKAPAKAPARKKSASSKG